MQQEGVGSNKEGIAKIEAETSRFAVVEAFRALTELFKNIERSGFSGLKKNIKAVLALSLFLSACMPSMVGHVEAQTPKEPTQTSTQTETPTQTPTTAPTETPTLTPEPTEVPIFGEWSEDQAKTVELGLTREEVREMLDAQYFFPSSHSFPLDFSADSSAWTQACLLESMSYLNENSYVRIGKYAITVTGRCTYLDAKKEMQTITIPIMIEDTVRKMTSIPGHAVFPIVVRPRTIQEFIKSVTTADMTIPEREVKPGVILNLDFNMPNARNNHIYPQVENHGELISQTHTYEELERFAKTGDPSEIGKMLIPIEVRYLRQSPAIQE